MSTRVIVVGGGLAGLSAAHTILERGGRVVVIEKNPFMGGNSTKATSGINGAGTSTQRRLGIPDTPEIFEADTTRSARDLAVAPLIKVLTHESGAAVEWIQEKFGVDMSLVARLGGHSEPRTHRGKEKFPGMTMTYALMEKIEEYAESIPDRVQIIKKATVNKLLRNGETVIGVEYTAADGQTHTEHGPVIIATGGYAADFSSTSLLKRYRPDLLDLPTTNGDHCTGDGIKMTEAIGGNTIHMEKVQVHPTGLVDPKEPDAKIKFLAAEALRGVGGLLLDANGKRFADELGHRDYVTGMMWKNKGPFRLVLNGKGGKEIEWHCKHYQGRGLMKYYPTGADLAKDMGIPVATLQDTFAKYNDIAKSKNDPFGKKFFHNLPFDTNDNFWVAIVTPVLHFTMGGIQIDEHSQVFNKSGAIIPGLFAAGEVAGGVHGANRLGGSSLLGCVVYGRVAGATAASYLLSDLSSNAARRIGGIAGHLGGVTISVNGLTLNISADGGVASSAPVAAPKPAAVAAPAPAAAPPATKEYTLAEIAKHNTEKDCWVAVNGQVLNVTSFLGDHPGGKKSILLYAGKDASEEFNMLHKPEVVAKYAPNTIIGTLKK
ncbi:FAD binding domain-containing protein [Cladochytrium replicatum]|nr:FAD binding domain-containing protein [Cladochytrium replicatum]